jgi:ComF family protein
VCLTCSEGLRGYDCAFVYGGYDGPLRRMVHVMKYERVESLAAPLGAMALRALPREMPHDLVVAMPMHWFRRYQRGFNQAELLARVVASRLGLPLAAPVARRWCTRQSGLTLAERRRNVGTSFQVRRPLEVSGKRVLLVDDVLTTGATAAACGRELKRAGAAHVTLLTLARADRRLGAHDSPGAES